MQRWWRDRKIRLAQEDLEDRQAEHDAQSKKIQSQLRRESINQIVQSRLNGGAIARPSPKIRRLQLAEMRLEKSRQQLETMHNHITVAANLGTMTDLMDSVSDITGVYTLESVLGKELLESTAEMKSSICGHEGAQRQVHRDSRRSVPSDREPRRKRHEDLRREGLFYDTSRSSRRSPRQ